jgi:hypothetical protein
MRVNRLLTILTLLFCIIAAIITLGVMIYQGQESYLGIWRWLLFLFFGAYAVAPYIAIGVITLKIKGTDIQLFITPLLAVIIMTSFGLYAYYDGFFVHLDAQSGLLFLFIPAYQWLGILATVGMNNWLRRRHLNP